MSSHRIEISINGSDRELEVAADRLLIDVLRDDLGLTGTKEGCSIGVCGLCSVLVDGELMSACLLHAVTVNGRAVRTVEGLANADGSLSALQDAFIRHGGFQCGICTPGQLMAATAFLDREVDDYQSDVRAEIQSWMRGNLCRCTGYEGIVNAIASVVEVSPAR